MDQDLIDRLWEHTRLSDAENARRAREAGYDDAVAWFRAGAAPRMPGSLNLPDGPDGLFLSFHPETSNANRHSHEFFELLYVCRGDAVGVIDEREVPLAEGSLCIMNPNAVHHFRKYEESTDLVLNIVLPKETFQRAMFRMLLADPVLNAFFLRFQIESGRPPSFLHLPHLDRDVDGLVGLLVREYLDRARYGPVVIESLLTLLFAFILRAHDERTRHGDRHRDEIVGYVYRNHRTAGLEAIAARFSYHPKYLSTLIHRWTGQTFRDLVAGIRLQDAANGLLFTDDPIERIAERVGYQDKSGFYARFRAAYGMTPGEYRKRRG